MLHSEPSAEESVPGGRAPAPPRADLGHLLLWAGLVGAAAVAWYDDLAGKEQNILAGRSYAAIAAAFGIAALGAWMSGAVGRVARVWRVRELVGRLAMADLKLRYKTPLLGLAWSLLVPFFLLILFALVFGRLLGIETTTGVSYVAFLITGLMPMTALLTVMNQGTTSMVDGGSLLQKASFPREAVPSAGVVAGTAVLVVDLLVVAVFLWVVGEPPPLRALVLVPVIVTVQVVLMLGLVLALSTLQVFSRDVRYVVELLATAWFYGSPVVYPLDTVEQAAEGILPFYMINPMALLLTLYRHALMPEHVEALDLSVSLQPGLLLCQAAAVSLLVLAVGGALFARFEHRVVDFT